MANMDYISEEKYRIMAVLSLDREISYIACEEVSGKMPLLI